MEPNIQPGMESTHLNLDKIINGDFPAILRLLAMDLRQHTYLRVGTWLKELRTADLMYLVEVVDCATDDFDNAYTGTLVVLTMLLTQGEGLVIGEAESLHPYVNHVVRLLALESLYRKGLVEVLHDNISLGDEAGELIIASFPSHTNSPENK